MDKRFVSLEFLTVLFPLLAIGGSIFAWFQPASLSPLQPAIIPLLSLVMFGMGMTLSFAHFLEVLKKPGVISLAVLTQFFVMPLSAFYIAEILGLSRELTVGMVLVGASSGGTASNVICYLAKGDVALSILLTSTSTLVAVLATPSLTYLYLHESVAVPFAGMLASVLKIVLVPVLLGTLLNSLFARHFARIRAIFPLLSSLSIVLIIAIIVAVNRPTLASAGPLILLAVFLHNLCGLLSGYGVARLFGYSEQVCRTLCIEVGMQNSGLSVALAVGFFAPATALPGAIFSVWHNISGSLLAGYWGRKSES
ncbi:MAG: bile acid:sodium symporter family protein [Gammaproteobacteria bacterium]